MTELLKWVLGTIASVMVYIALLLASTNADAAILILTVENILMFA
jgi:hypothetical protein